MCVCVCVRVYVTITNLSFSGFWAFFFPRFFAHVFFFSDFLSLLFVCVSADNILFFFAAAVCLCVSPAMAMVAFFFSV